MATGGIFTIITNDGKQDRMLMATALLHERLRAINSFKRAQKGGAADALQNLPTLLDIEKTHILFTNAHFKPFAAIGFEYNKVRSASGNPTLGQTIQFSIPQFGDFFHDICVHVVMTQPTLTETATTQDSDEPLFRWCHFPGERLLKKVQQEVNGNPLDEYTSHAANMHREYRVAPNKRLGWDRCVGQEVPEKGFVAQRNWAGNGVAASTVTGRMAAEYYVGNQTPTETKSSNLEMFIPLLFWYNKDVRLAVPSVAIPYGQRFINIELATAANLVGMVPRGISTWAAPAGTLTDPTLSTIELYINNIFVNPEVHKIYIRRIGFSLIRVHRQQTYTSNTNSNELLLQQLKWPIEYLCVGLKLKAYHAGTAAGEPAQHLDKWHTFHTVTKTTRYADGHAAGRRQQLFAGGTGTVAVTVTTGVLVFATTDTFNVLLEKDDLLYVSGQIHRVVSVTAATTAASWAVGATGAAAEADATLSVVVEDPAIVGGVPAAIAADTDVEVVKMNGLMLETDVCTKNFVDLTVKAHGISLYDAMPEGFFNAYTAYHYGGPNINTPEDCGLAFIPFCLYPGTYQPSGHINVSRSREFYLNWNSLLITTSNEATLVVIASAINFLLISDGSAVLRYST
jgi:hypothetical protein